MRTFILLSLVSGFVSVFSLPVFAQTDDGIVPAVEDACDALKEPGITKGLYGLCVAYCEAEASSEAVLRNYNKRKSESDPEMPCLETVVECPCWTTDDLADAVGPVDCVASDGGLNSSEYSGFTFFLTGPNEDSDLGFCFSVVNFVFTDVPVLTDEEFESCLTSLAASQAVDFPDGCDD